MFWLLNAELKPVNLAADEVARPARARQGGLRCPRDPTEARHGAQPLEVAQEELHKQIECPVKITLFTKKSHSYGRNH